MPKNTITETKLVKGLKTKFNKQITEEYVEPNRIKISTSPTNLKAVALAIKELGFDQIISQGATDYPDDNLFRVEYHAICVSIKKFRRIMFAIMTTIPKNKPEIETLLDIWPSVEFHEQETLELHFSIIPVWKDYFFLKIGMIYLL